MVNDSYNKNISHSRPYYRTKDAHDTIADKNPVIGMTASEVVQTSWGAPSQKNISEYSFGTHEQWVYSGNRYVYIENGIVTSVSYSK